MIPSDRPTLDESYGRAISSSHLMVLPERCSVDYLIAAGWVRDGLGASLFRLRSEWDSNATLRSMRQAGERLGAFAVQLAARVGYRTDTRAVCEISGRALELWIDPNCPMCTGRGYSGGFGVPIVLCVTCDATGKRIHAKGFRLARADAGHDFGRALIDEIDRKTNFVVDSMRRYLR
jgi:hypothetical protein